MGTGLCPVPAECSRAATQAAVRRLCRWREADYNARVQGADMATAAVVPPAGTCAAVRRAAPRRHFFFAPQDLYRPPPNASWWAPFLIIAIVCLLFVYVVDQKVGFRKVAENQIQSQPKQAERIERLPADQREKVMRQQATVTRIISYLISLLYSAGMQSSPAFCSRPSSLARAPRLNTRPCLRWSSMPDLPETAEVAAGNPVASGGSQRRRI